MSGEEWDRVVRTNLDAFYNVLHPLVMPMIHTCKDQRQLWLFSSLSGQAGNRGQVNYSAAEAGVIGASKALSKELAKRQITVNSVAPGLIETELSSRPKRAKKFCRTFRVRRLGRPEEVAATVVFLFSEGAGYMPGKCWASMAASCEDGAWS